MTLICMEMWKLRKFSFVNRGYTLEIREKIQISEGCIYIFHFLLISLCSSVFVYFLPTLKNTILFTGRGSGGANHIKMFLELELSSLCVGIQ